MVTLLKVRNTIQNPITHSGSELGLFRMPRIDCRSHDY